MSTKSHLVAGGLGFVSHLILASREIDRHAHIPILFGLSVVSSLALLQSLGGDAISVGWTWKDIVQSITCYLLALFSSITIYRGFCHRLRKVKN